LQHTSERILLTEAVAAQTSPKVKFSTVRPTVWRTGKGHDHYYGTVQLLSDWLSN